jgi:uncharacterized phage protein (TIGR01671 family)
MNLQYKIWDKPNKEWVKPPYCINQFGDLHDFEVVVYTGLNDCKRTKEYPNGQPIYEGDIVTAVNKGWTRKFEIMWNEDKARFMVWCGSQTNISFDLTCDTILDYHIEIIGNIYENTELLEGGVINE